jgi:ferredoxin--NADP+ reductase
MFLVRDARTLAPSVKRFWIEAPRVARHWHPGQFVIVRVSADGERIPLTIADGDREAGTICLIVQAVGATTKAINRLDQGDRFADVAGPLGEPSQIRVYGTVVVVGGGVGTAIAYPVARALSEVGNRVLAIIGGRSREYVILEEELSQVAEAVFPSTDDGSYGHHGLVTDVLAELLEQQEAIDRVFAVGPIPMMRAVADLTLPHNIETSVSLNPIMVDGTGMCGGCRVLIDGVTKFACVDGPEFDAHHVNFDVLEARNRAYRGFELSRTAPAESANS